MDLTHPSPSMQVDHSNLGRKSTFFADDVLRCRNYLADERVVNILHRQCIHPLLPLPLHLIKRSVNSSVGNTTLHSSYMTSPVSLNIDNWTRSILPSYRDFFVSRKYDGTRVWIIFASVSKKILNEARVLGEELTHLSRDIDDEEKIGLTLLINRAGNIWILDGNRFSCSNRMWIHPFVFEGELVEANVQSIHGDEGCSEKDPLDHVLILFDCLCFANNKDVLMRKNLDTRMKLIDKIATSISCDYFHVVCKRWETLQSYFLGSQSSSGAAISIEEVLSSNTVLNLENEMSQGFELLSIKNSIGEVRQEFRLPIDGWIFMHNKTKPCNTTGVSSTDLLEIFKFKTRKTIDLWVGRSAEACSLRFDDDNSHLKSETLGNHQQDHLIAFGDVAQSLDQCMVRSVTFNRTRGGGEGGGYNFNFFVSGQFISDVRSIDAFACSEAIVEFDIVQTMLTTGKTLNVKLTPLKFRSDKAHANSRRVVLSNCVDHAYSSKSKYVLSIQLMVETIKHCVEFNNGRALALKE